jgi:hypothetical protein
VKLTKLDEKPIDVNMTNVSSIENGLGGTNIRFLAGGKDRKVSVSESTQSGASNARRWKEKVSARTRPRGDPLLFADGVIIYDDVFGDEHRTTFRLHCGGPDSVRLGLMEWSPKATTPTKKFKLAH